MLFAAAGNDASGQLHFPARDPRVFGITGTDQSNLLWNESGSCGSNTGGNSANPNDWPHFSAPAYKVYSTMYPDRTWIGGPCHVYNDGDQTSAYGYCTGTSMASPLAAGVAALLRSADPLATPQDIFEVMRDTADNSGQSGQNATYGWGIPQARMALNQLYGTENGVQLLNSLIPLFRMYSSTAEDNALTTKPQMAVSLYHASSWDYNSYNGSPLVAGYPSFPDWSNDPPAAPAADIFILSGHEYHGYPTRPLYLMSWAGTHGGNPDNADYAIVTSHIELEAFKSSGYAMRGKLGYIVAPCNPEPYCMPPGMTWVYRAYNPEKNDHLVVPFHLLTNAQSEGYDQQITMLGYSYIN